MVVIIPLLAAVNHNDEVFTILLEFDKYGVSIPTLKIVMVPVSAMVWSCCFDR